MKKAGLPSSNLGKIVYDTLFGKNLNELSPEEIGTRSMRICEAVQRKHKYQCGREPEGKRQAQWKTTYHCRRIRGLVDDDCRRRRTNFACINWRYDNNQRGYLIPLAMSVTWLTSIKQGSEFSW